MNQSASWREAARVAIGETLEDILLKRILQRSNLTRVQFETLLVDQLGDDMANKTLTREEMTRLLRSGRKISRGAFYRTLRQARLNVSESIHTVLLLGYSGLLESPSLTPFQEASERLKSQTGQLKEHAKGNVVQYRALIESILQDLEEAHLALQGKKA